jgi:putative flippase GtrA
VPGLIPILQGVPSAVTLQRDVQHSVSLTSRRIIDTPVTLHFQINERFTQEQSAQNKWHKATLLLSVFLFLFLLHLLHLLLLSLPILFLVLLLRLLFLIITNSSCFAFFVWRP